MGGKVGGTFTDRQPFLLEITRINTSGNHMKPANSLLHWLALPIFEGGKQFAIYEGILTITFSSLCPSIPI